MSDAPLVDPAAAEALVNGTHGDPFSELGLHKRGKNWVVTAFVPGAERLWVLTGKAGKADAATPVENASGVFSLTLAKKSDYRLRAQGHGTEWEFEDPFRFGPVMGEMDEYLLGEGTHKRLWQVLGAHLITHEGVDGTHFAVWAPNAQRVSVVGSSVSLDSVKNGKFDNIKIVKSKKAFFNKVSYKKDGEAMKFWENDAELTSQGRLSVSSSRYVSGEAITFWLPISNFKLGKQDLFIIDTGSADVVYHVNNSFFSSKVRGTYEWVKLDKINRMAEIRFEAEFEDTNGKKINITEGSMEVQYK